MRIGIVGATGAVLLSLLACDANGPERSSALELTGPSEPFGSISIGGQSPARAYTLTNQGDAPTGSLLVRLSGPDAGEFAIVKDDCSGVALEPHAACRVEVRLRPLTNGPKEAQLAVADGSGRTASTSLAGSAGGGGVVLSAATHDFGPTGIDEASDPFTFLVRNSADTDDGPLAVALSGTSAGQFEITTDGCSGRSVGPVSTCSVTVRFRPTGPGTSTAELTVSTPAGTSAASTLRGIGGEPGSLAISPAAHDFGAVHSSATRAVVTALVTNQSAGQHARITVQLGGLDPADFAVQSDQCSNREVAPGASCSVEVDFLALPGSHSAVLQVSEQFGGAAELALSGTGLAPPTLDVSSDLLAFGPTIVGATSAAMPVTFTNVGDASTGPLGSQVLSCGDYYYYYCYPSTAFLIESDGCAGRDLAPGGTCEVRLTFQPTYVGVSTSKLEVGNASVQLEGLGAGLGLTPGLLAFPSTPSGSASASQAVTVVNNGPTATGPIVSVLYGSGFTRTDGCTGMTLTPGASCSIAVTFAPSNPGVHSGSLEVSASPGGLVTIVLQGEATQ